MHTIFLRLGIQMLFALGVCPMRPRLTLGHARESMYVLEKASRAGLDGVGRAAKVHDRHDLRLGPRERLERRHHQRARRAGGAVEAVDCMLHEVRPEADRSGALQGEVDLIGQEVVVGEHEKVLLTAG